MGSFGHEYDVDNDASINHYTLGTPCFEEFNYGVGSKIWHKYFSNSLEGFDYNYNNKSSSGI